MTAGAYPNRADAVPPVRDELALDQFPSLPLACSFTANFLRTRVGAGLLTPDPRRRSGGQKTIFAPS